VVRTSNTVHAPGSSSTNLYGINDLGVVTGSANYAGPNGNYTWKNFTAVCSKLSTGCGAAFLPLASLKFGAYRYSGPWTRSKSTLALWTKKLAIAGAHHFSELPEQSVFAIREWQVPERST
jgi:hypothetical protein